MQGLDQQGRLLKVKTALGDGAFLLRRLTVEEGLEQPFTISGELVGERADVAPEELLGTAIACHVITDAGERHFHGIVAQFTQLGSSLRELHAYAFRAMPKLWFLSRAMDCRIFQEKSVEDIVRTVVDARNVGPVEFKHMPSGPRPYCVQFNETDLDFVHRVLDESGCTYFFDHTESGHGFTVSGGSAGFPTLPGDPLVVRPDIDRLDAVNGWTGHGIAQTGGHKSWDFDNLTPSQLLQAEAPSTLQAPGDMQLSMYRWPGGQAVRPEAGATADLRMRRHEAQAHAQSGRSVQPLLTAGSKVKIKEGDAGAAKTWLLTGVLHDAHDQSRILDGGTAEYGNSFSVIPGDRAWRSPVHRPRPIIPGVQSALVVGPSGEEIHCDEYGRIKVHFLWDHLDDKKNETSSCWVRVAQPFAGKWGGAWFLPRIGDEVLVAFLDGDSDRPVVIGSLYNADGKPPWKLPARKTRSGFRSRSSKGGTEDNHHVIGFDDEMGAEHLVLFGERDMSHLTKKDLKTEVGGNETHDVKGSHADSPDGKRTTTIKGDETLTITQGNRVTKVDQGNETLTVSLGKMEVTVSAGSITIKAPASTIALEAGLGIELKSGPSSLKVEPAGITLKSLKLTTQADLLHENKGAIKQHNGDGMLTLKGGITMIG